MKGNEMNEQKKNFHSPQKGKRSTPQHGTRTGVKPEWRGKQVQHEKTEIEGLPARRIALRVIRQVTEQGAFASLSLDKALENCGLISTDRRLVSRLVYDTLDHIIYLDYALSQVMARNDTDIKLRNILRLGACQILLEDRIPERSHQYLRSALY